MKAGSLSTKREVDYSELTDSEKFYKAINDSKEYLGETKFEEITELLKLEKPSLQTFANMLSMLAGIEGYPVKAWYEYAFGFNITVANDLTSPSQADRDRNGKNLQIWFNRVVNTLIDDFEQSPQTAMDSVCMELRAMFDRKQK